MSNELSENIFNYLQRILPLFSSLLLLFLSYVPLDFLLFSNIRPAVGIICVYFWMIHRPDLFNLLSVYILALIDDIISNVPCGTNIFVLLVVYVILSNVLRFLMGKPFIVTWYGFAIIALITFFAKWLMLSIYYGQFLPFLIVCFSYLVTVVSYPFVSLILAFVQNNFIADEEL